MRKSFFTFVFLAFSFTATVAAISFTVTPAAACELDVCHW
jgi:hypothetical protein